MSDRRYLRSATKLFFIPVFYSSTFHRSFPSVFFLLRSVVLLSSPPIPHKSTHHPFPAPLRAARNRLKMTPTNLFPVQTSAPRVTTTLSIDIVPRGHLVLANPRQNYPLLSRRLFLCPPDPTRSSLCSRDNLHQLSYFTEASQRIGR